MRATASALMANWMATNLVAGTTNAEAERAAIRLEWVRGTCHGAQENGQGHVVWH